MILSQHIKVSVNGTWKKAKFIRYMSITEARVFVFDVADYMVVRLSDIKEM
jgi:hypothetical protein